MFEATGKSKTTTIEERELLSEDEFKEKIECFK